MPEENEEGIANLSRGRTILFRCIAVLLGIVAAGILGEVVLRAGGYGRSYFNPLTSFHEGSPLVGYIGKPNFVGRFRRPDFDTVIAQNALGFRKQEHQNPRAQCTHKVLAFGDSFVWGWGVSQGQVFTDQMSLLMPHYFIENFGLSATGTVQQFKLFQAFGEKQLAPGDTVLLMYFYNDFDDDLDGRLRAVLQNGQVKTVGPLSQLGSAFGDSVKSFLKEHSYLLNAIFFASDYIKAALKEHHEVRVSAERTQVIVARYFLAAFRDACAARHARFIVALIPGQAELGEMRHHDERELRFEQQRRRMLFQCTRELGIPTIDLLPPFMAAKKAGTYKRLTYEDDGHWNPHGHLLAAQVISKYILRADGAKP